MIPAYSKARSRVKLINPAPYDSGWTKDRICRGVNAGEIYLLNRGNGVRRSATPTARRRSSPALTIPIPSHSGPWSPERPLRIAADVQHTITGQIPPGSLASDYPERTVA